MNPVRVDFVRRSVAEALNRTHLFESQQLKGLNILDVGCGGGLLSESLARLGANMTSIDPAPENIKVASSHSRNDPLTATINYKQSTIGKTDFLSTDGHIFFQISFEAVCWAITMSWPPLNAYLFLRFTEEILASGQKFDVVCALEVTQRCIVNYFMHPHIH